MIDVMMVVYAVFVFMLTTAIGSFLNVVIYRLPRKMNLAKPASHCPKCDNPIKWYDNIPIVSYIILGGKCRHCKEPISPRYIIVEAMTGIISTLIFLRFGLTANALFGIVMFLLLIPISFIDAEHMIIPDSCIIGLLVLGIFGIFFNNLEYGYGIIKIDFVSKLIALGIVVVISFIIQLLERLMKRDLMGGGDLKLFAVSSLILGWQLFLLMLCFSSIIACVVEITKEQIRKAKNSKEEDENEEEAPAKEAHLFAFGPYIALSVMIVYCFGINIIEWWLQLIA